MDAMPAPDPDYAALARPVAFMPTVELLEDGGWAGQNEVLRIRTLPNEGGRIFKRRAIKKAGTPEAYEECLLVAELDGVRVYIDGNALILTRQDLYP